MSDERRSEASAWAPPGTVPEPATEEQPAIAPDDAAAGYEPALVEPDDAAMVEGSALDEPAPATAAAVGYEPAPVDTAAIQDATSAAAPAGAERPELLAGAAFAGGLMAALILKRLAD